MEAPGARADDRIGRRVFADEEKRGGNDVHRIEQLEGFLGEQVFGHARAGNGRDRVDLDVVLRAFQLQRLGQAGEAELGGTVVRLAEIAEQAGRRSGHQHAAIGLFAHGFPHCLGDVRRTVEVHVDDEFEVVHRHLGEGLVTQHAGIVDDDMHAAPLLLGVGDHLFHLLVFSDRAAVRHRFAAGFLDFLDDLQRHVRMAGAVARTTEIVDHDLGAAAGEFECIFATQSAACAGDDGYLVLEVDAHGAAPALSFT